VAMRRRTPSTMQFVPKATTVPAASPSPGERKIKAAERKAAKIVDLAREEAGRLRVEAEKDAARTRSEAEEQARGLVLDARATAEGVRAEGMELVSNLREMGDVLRANAERLLADIQSIHARMVRELDRVDPARSRSDAAAEAPVPAAEPAGSADELDVPDFIARR
jgi:vacuolar-type H+-ATPase subunit H